MSADIIQAQYEQLEAIARRFNKSAQANDAVQRQVQRSMNELRNAWDGKGSGAFFSEMDAVVLPALQRLTNALEAAQSTTQQISSILRAAEEDAASPFKGDSALPIGSIIGGTLVGGAASQAWTWRDTLRVVGKTLLWAYKDRGAIASIIAAGGNWSKMVRFVANADGTYRAFGSQAAKKALSLPPHFTRFGQAAIDKSLKSHSLWEMVKTAAKNNGPFSSRATQLLDDIKSIGGVKTAPLWSVNGFLKNVKGPAIISSLITLGSNTYEFGWGKNSDKGLLSREFMTSTGADLTAGLGIVGTSTAIGTMIPVPGVGTAAGFVVGLGLQYAYDRWGQEAWRGAVDNAAQGVSAAMGDAWRAARPVADRISHSANDVWDTLTSFGTDLGRGSAKIFNTASGAAKSLLSPLSFAFGG